MAKLTKKPVEGFEYILTLSQDEAECLYAVTGLITGHPVDSNRRYTSNIRSALATAGFNFYASHKGFEGNITAEE